MVIESYDVRASAQRTYLAVESTTISKQSLSAARKNTAQKTEPEPSDQVKDMLEREEENNRKLMEKLKAPALSKLALSPKDPRTPDELKLTLLEMMIEHLTGKKISLKMQSPSFSGGGSGLSLPPLSGVGGQGRAASTEELSVEHFQYESESVAYQAQGVVKTADGREINLDLSMNLSRQFVSYTNVTVTNQKRVCDPLVINYGGTAASLTDETYAFDLTMDGKDEQIHFAGAGSGFLALDRDGDGKINDGSELFGPTTGSGFDELRQYDADGNGWIDESDDVFSKLLIWSKDKDGNDQLFSLKELDVGAIYLGDVDTRFSITDDGNNAKGVMQSTSFFLKESGGAGTLSHIDLTI